MRRSWQLQFIALAAIWGSSFLFIKLIGERWPPLWVAFGRVSLGAATLVAIALARRERLRFPPRIWLHLAVTAVLFNSLPFTLFALGERHVSSIVAGLWNATTPLWTLLTVIVVLPGERPDGRRMLGIAAGFLGAVLILMPWRALGGGRLAGELACGAAALCYGLGFAYMRRFVSGASGGAAALSAGQLICATAQVAVLLPLSSAPSWALGPGRITGILSLGVLGSGVAYVLKFRGAAAGWGSDRLHRHVPDPAVRDRARDRGAGRAADLERASRRRGAAGRRRVGAARRWHARPGRRGDDRAAVPACSGWDRCLGTGAAPRP